MQATAWWSQWPCVLESMLRVNFIEQPIPAGTAQLTTLVSTKFPSLRQSFHSNFISNSEEAIAIEIVSRKRKSFVRKKNLMTCKSIDDTKNVYLIEVGKSKKNLRPEKMNPLIISWHIIVDFFTIEN